MLNYDKNKELIFVKPSACIAIHVTNKEKFSTEARKFYDALIYFAGKEIEKNENCTRFKTPLSKLKKVVLNSKYKNNNFLKETLKKIFKVQVEYNILGKDNYQEWGIFSLIESPIIKNDKDQIIIEYSLPTIVLQCLKRKRGYYTKLDLVILKNLKSKYSIILYELILDYANAEIPLMTIEKFRELFEIENKYKNINDVRKFILDPSIKEINDNPQLQYEVNYELFKEGRRYTHIKFHILNKNTLKKDKSDNQVIDLKDNKKKENHTIKQFRNKKIEINGRVYNTDKDGNVTTEEEVLPPWKVFVLLQAKQAKILN